MSIVLIYLAAVGVPSAWWLSRQRLASKPWLEAGPISVLPSASPPVSAAKIGIAVLLAVIGLLFALLIAAYTMRVPPETWGAAPDPGLLWLTTALLALGSVALHAAKRSAARHERDGVILSLLAAGVATLGFIGGQALAWRQLAASGAGSAADAASAFFYLITALHALHLAGGLVALGAITARSLSATDTGGERLGIDLCALYWDALLAIWLILFGVLFRTPWSGWIYALCRPV
jgi:cytochrome c oxidase subunit 3